MVRYHFEPTPIAKLFYSGALTIDVIPGHNVTVRSQFVGPITVPEGTDREWSRSLLKGLRQLATINTETQEVIL